LFCKHEWKVLYKTIAESAYEQMGKPRGLSNYPSWLFSKRVMMIVVCEHCGKIKKYTQLFDEF